MPVIYETRCVAEWWPADMDDRRKSLTDQAKGVGRKKALATKAR